MSKTLPPPVPTLLPETAPFTADQRAWLNGFFAGYLGLDGGVTALSPEEGAKLMAGVRRRRRGRSTTATTARRPGTTRRSRCRTA